MNANVRHGLVRAGLLAVVGLAAAALPALTLRAQPPDHKPAKPAAAAAPTAPARTPGDDHRLDQQINLAKDEIELLQAHLEVKQALLRNSNERLEQARRWMTYYEGLFRERKVTEDRLLAAKDDVLMLETHVAAEKAEAKVAEIRLRHAKRRVDYGELPVHGPDSRLNDLEHRQAVMEVKIDELQHEVGRLRREQPGESRFSPR